MNDSFGIWGQQCGGSQEPNRLWRRYLVGNSRFLWYLAQEVVNGRTR